jgi:hypothetical protein
MRAAGARRASQRVAERPLPLVPGQVVPDGQVHELLDAAGVRGPAITEFTITPDPAASLAAGAQPQR